MSLAAAAVLASPVHSARALTVSAVLHGVLLVGLGLQAQHLPDYGESKPIINLEGATPAAIDAGERILQQAQGAPALPKAEHAARPRQPSQFYLDFSLVPHVGEVGLGDDDSLRTPTPARPQTVRRLAANSSVDSVEARYLNRWQSKVESVGTLYMPAHLTHLRGQLVVMTQISATGQLRDVRILQPSEHSALDLATLEILRLAAPFPAFPPSMRQEYDLLEIVREWDFFGNGLAQTAP